MAINGNLVPKTALYLANVAAEHRLATYGEVAAEIGMAVHQVAEPLNEVRSVCIEHGWPALTCLVVDEVTGKPGESFLDPWLPRTADPRRRDAMVENFRRMVYVFDWSPLIELFSGDNTWFSAPKVRVLLEAWYRGKEIEIGFADDPHFRSTIDTLGRARGHEDLYRKLDSRLRLQASSWKMRSGA